MKGDDISERLVGIAVRVIKLVDGLPDTHSQFSVVCSRLSVLSCLFPVLCSQFSVFHSLVPSMDTGRMPKSVAELARIAQRGFKAVYRDVEALRDLGLIEVADRRRGASSRLRSTTTEIVLRIAV